MKNQKSKYIILTCLVAMLLSGCGTISEIESADESPFINVSSFSKVQVADFTNQTGKTSAKDEEDIAIAGRLFADKIAAEIKAKGLFAEVVRVESIDTHGAETLSIGGTITRYSEGNAVARFMIGLGAGSSYFDADVIFSGGVENSELASLKVDKNSWVLGGGLAAGQTVEVYMREAAKKIADELAKAYRSTSVPQSGN